MKFFSSTENSFYPISPEKLALRKEELFKQTQIELPKKQEESQEKHTAVRFPNAA